MEQCFPRGNLSWQHLEWVISFTVILLQLYSPFKLDIRYYLTSDGVWHCQRAPCQRHTPTQSNMGRITHLTLCQNVRAGSSLRHDSARRIYWPLQVKQKLSRCINLSKGAVWASGLIWPPFGKWRIYFLRQTAINAAVALVWAGGVLEEFRVWSDQW